MGMAPASEYRPEVVIVISKNNMETNERLDIARRIVEQTGSSLFLTGKAGTGKTTFLRNLRNSTRKRIVVAAPTGIAAINAGGVTLHSFFQLDFGPFIPGMKRNKEMYHRFNKEKIRMIRGMDLLVIDEISMVRADVLDAVDDVLRRYRDRTLPFGGVQLLLIGDLQQLPPVVTEAERELLAAHYASPYFFDSHALQQISYETVELDRVYRQNDMEFLGLLNAIRENRADAMVLNRLNSRCDSKFDPDDSEGYIRLTTHNYQAVRFNSERMEALRSQPVVYQAEVKGDFPESSYPVDRDLVLKEGAQVMFVKNDTEMPRRFYNGMIGHVTELTDTSVSVRPVGSEIDIDVQPMEWKNVKLVINDVTKEIDEKEEGSFRQFPLKAAWAITIHKSQGLTFDRAIINASSSFAHGQAYVALSRCRNLAGLVLNAPLTSSAIICDSTVSAFMQNHSGKPDEQHVETLGKEYALASLLQLFNFQPLDAALAGTVRIVQENFSRLYPTIVGEFVDFANSIKGPVSEVGMKFARQCRELVGAADGDLSDERVQKRIKEAANYFMGQLNGFDEILEKIPRNHDNRRVTEKLRDRIELLTDQLNLKRRLLEAFAEEDFTKERYLDLKASVLLDNGMFKTHRKKTPAAVKSEYSKDNVNPGLYDALVKWRYAKSLEIGKPAYTVLNNRSLLAVSNYVPRTTDDLLALPGFGQVTVNKYGEEVLKEVEKYLEEHGDEINPMPLSPGQKKRKKHHD